MTILILRIDENFNKWSIYLQTIITNSMVVITQQHWIFTLSLVTRNSAPIFSWCNVHFKLVTINRDSIAFDLGHNSLWAHLSLAIAKLDTLLNLLLTLVTKVFKNAHIYKAGTLLNTLKYNYLLYIVHTSNVYTVDILFYKGILLSQQPY